MGLIEQCLDAEPMIRAKTLLERLIQHKPERYGERQLPTLQRRLRGCRLQRTEREMEQILDAKARVLREADPEETAVLPGVKENG